jgi:hypothetical protein
MTSLDFAVCLIVSAANNNGLFLSWLTTTCQRATTINWMLLLALTFTLAATMTWFTDMSAALSAARGKGGGPPKPPYWPPIAAPVAPSPASSGSQQMTPAAHLAPHQPPANSHMLYHPDLDQQLNKVLQLIPVELQQAPWFADLAQQLSQHQQQQQQAVEANGIADSPASASRDNAFVNTDCPPGCLDMGVIAQVFGLPWSCFCQTWLLADLLDKLSKVRRCRWPQQDCPTSFV